MCLRRGGLNSLSADSKNGKVHISPVMIFMPHTRPLKSAYPTGNVPLAISATAFTRAMRASAGPTMAFNRSFFINALMLSRAFWQITLSYSRIPHQMSQCGGTQYSSGLPPLQPISALYNATFQLRTGGRQMSACLLLKSTSLAETLLG